jgi:hypothetical protein
MHHLGDPLILAVSDSLTPTRYDDCAPPFHPVAVSNLAEQIREALSMFARNDTAPALIGGLAVVAHQVVRATKDVDFLVEAEAADKVHAALLDLGYECLYRSEDAANYVRAAEGLDLLYAHRPLARRLLAQASERETPMGRMRIISVEGLIGFKLQGFVNDATRTRDLDDIRSLFKIHLTSLNMDEVREYFALFSKPDLLNELLG